MRVAPRGDGRGTPIDFSRVQHGVGEVDMVGGDADAPKPTEASVRDEIRRQLGH